MIKKYIVYAVADNGDGHVQVLGEFEDVDDIKIRTGMFSKDVLITIEAEWEKIKEDD